MKRFQQASARRLWTKVNSEAAIERHVGGCDCVACEEGEVLTRALRSREEGKNERVEWDVATHETDLPEE
eukprot:6210634-Pleurochrysis_carterae.AAC.2